MNLLNFRQPKASCRLSKDSKIMILFSFVSFLSTLYMYLLFFSLLQVLFISRPHTTRILALIIFVNFFFYMYMYTHGRPVIESTLYVRMMVI